MRRKERGRDSGLKKRRDKSKGRTKRERGGEEGEEWRMEDGGDGAAEPLLQLRQSCCCCPQVFQLLTFMNIDAGRMTSSYAGTF